MLSIVIPTLNEEKYLPQLLKSIREQSFSDYEIIVSDGKSLDQTVEIAKSYDCKIIVSDGVRRHPSIQRNDGANVARGNIILFLDADTSLPDNGFLQKTVEDFYKRKLGVAGFFMDFKSNNFFYKFYHGLYNGLAFLAQRIKPLAVGAGIVIKRDLHNKIGGFDETIFIGEDQVYCENAARLEKFRLIKKTKIFFSIRRFEEEGRWKLFFKLFFSTLYVLIFGPIRKKIIKYNFGDHK